MMNNIQKKKNKSLEPKSHEIVALIIVDDKMLLCVCDFPETKKRNKCYPYDDIFLFWSASARPILKKRIEQNFRNKQTKKLIYHNNSFYDYCERILSGLIQFLYDHSTQFYELIDI